jgi:ABC-2 type transport system permease protein
MRKMVSPDKYVFVSGILLLLYRNLFAAIDKMFFIWQILFPVFQIYIMGYAYSALIGNQGINVGALSISYVAFLTTGMMGFNVMQGSQIAGTIFWNDRKNGMFHQILAMPFNKIQYVIANLVTLIIIGLTSAAAIILIGLPTIFQDMNITLWGISYTIFALVAGSIFFGSFTIILSTKMKSSETYNVFSNGLFIFFIFVSSVFYPADGLPQPLTVAFYFNPLTYIADITRAGIFSQVVAFTNLEVLALASFSVGAFIIATRAMVKLQV